MSCTATLKPLSPGLPAFCVFVGAQHTCERGHASHHKTGILRFWSLALSVQHWIPIQRQTTVLANKYQNTSGHLQGRVVFHRFESDLHSIFRYFANRHRM